MGYTTDFEGQFDLDRELAPEHAAYLRQFSDTRRMKRDEQIVSRMRDPIRVAAKLPPGTEGQYFVGGDGWDGVLPWDGSILDYNREPSTQPGLWCQWVPTEDNDGIEWNGTEKFYDYVPWLRYLIDHFLKPWGYRLDGLVRWSGEEVSDIGLIEVKDNVVHVHERTHFLGDPQGVTRTPPKPTVFPPAPAITQITGTTSEEEDLKVLAAEFFNELFFDDSCEYGNPGLDCKRPFGNSDVEGDILELLDLEQAGDDGDGPCWSSKQRKYARDLYRVKLVPYLKKAWATYSKETA